MKSPHQFAIVGSGVLSAAGNSAGQTAASWLAQMRVTRRTSTPWQAEPVSLAPCSAIDAELQGVARLLALLSSALAEALPHGLQQEICQVAARGKRVHAILIMPNWLETDDITQLQAAWQKCLHNTLPGVAISAHLMLGDSAAPWAALEHAWQQVQAQPETVYTILAAADSWCEAKRVAYATRQQLLHCKGNQEGLIGGEAGAALVLKTVPYGPEKWRSHFPLAQAGQLLLHRPALHEAGHAWWPEANAQQRAAGTRQLHNTLTQALAQANLQAPHISHLASDMDGSSWRAEIESEALNKVLFQANPAATFRAPQMQLASMLGQTGCAGGVVQWALLPHLQSIQPCNSMLHWTLAAGGQSAACVLERST